MNKHQKGFAPIIIALIVLVLAGAGGTSYYLINKQSKLLNNNVDTSNWKMYTNSAAGFEIKYPSNWESPFENWGPSFTAGISIDNNNYCVVDAMGWLGSNDAEIADLIGKGYVKTSIKIDGIDAIRLTRNPTGAGLTEAIYFEVNDKSFRIGRNRGSGDKIEQDCIKNFNQIITTFNFIDEIVSWKTYTNNKYNYQINYPENIYTIENITSNPEKGMTDDNVTLYDIKSVQKTKECECGEYMAIYINAYSNPQGLSLQNYIEKNIKHWASDYSNLFINEQTSLNGIPAIKIGTEREQYYVLEKNNIIFSIGGFIDMNIINTFKFTDEETSNNEMANWKTYADSNIGFEFKYPNDWIIDNRSSVKILSPEIQKSIEDGKNSENSMYYQDNTCAYCFNISINSKVTSQTLEEYILENQGGFGGTPQKIKFAGENAYEVVNAEMLTTNGILVKKNNYLYNITIIPGNKTETTTKTENQILSSFKFLK